MRKYAFILMFLLAPVFVLCGVFTFTDCIKDLKTFPSVTGSVTGYSVHDQPGRVQAGKYSFRIHSDIYCLELNNYPVPIIIGKKNSNMLQSALKPGDIITIYYEGESLEGQFPEEIQIQRGTQVLDPKKNWERQEKITAFFMVAMGIFLLVYGIRALSKFRKDRAGGEAFEKLYQMYNK